MLKYSAVLVVLGLSLGASTSGLAQQLPADNPKQGWHFYQDPIKEEPKPESKPHVIVIPANPSAKKEEQAKNPCLAKETWVADCGFVDPGADFEFQAKQRDIILQQMSLRPDVPEVVEAAQRYMKWVVDKSIQVANMWYFNQVQNPDLDPTVKEPITEVGFALASRAREASRNAYFSIIKEQGGVLYYFTRADCQFCHDQAPYTLRVAQEMGLDVVNIPLDGQCLEGFEGDRCAPNIPLEQIAILKVSIVPALFLYVPENTWIRLGTGVVPDSVVMANTVNFFSAYRAALINGLDNGDGVRPSVTFDQTLNPRTTGVTAADGSDPSPGPSRQEVLKLMGY